MVQTFTHKFNAFDILRWGQWKVIGIDRIIRLGPMVTLAALKEEERNGLTRSAHVTMLQILTSCNVARWPSPEAEQVMAACSCFSSSQNQDFSKTSTLYGLTSQ